MLLLIDNYDSFTHNLARYFTELGAGVKVVRNDKISLAEIESLQPDALVISPGPCTPNEAGVSLQAISTFAGVLPILGVCLGHQAIGQAFGANVVRAQRIMHGKTSQICHGGDDLFDGVASPCEVTRYHSLVVESETLPACLTATAWCDDHGSQTIMAMRHTQLPVWGVQFHPESVLTLAGHQILNNFLQLARIK